MASPQLIFHPRDIDFESKDSCILVSDKLSSGEIKTIRLAKFPKLESHIWVASSGTSRLDGWSFVSLSIKALKASAKAVNNHLQIKSGEKWLNALPAYHVGGLSIFIRAHLLANEVIDISNKKWNPAEFVKNLKQKEVQYTSLVPTQLGDLIKLKLKAPEELKAVIIGGGALNEKVYRQARLLGWPVLPSFGMTEVCSQIATASLKSLEGMELPDLEILDHMNCRINSDSFLVLSSPSLFTSRFSFFEDKSEVDERIKDEYATSDIVELKNNTLVPKGRGFLVKKIKGKLINLNALNEKLSSLNKEHEAVLFFSPNQRSQFQIDIVATSMDGIEKLVESYNSQVSSLEKIHNIYRVKEIPKTDLGKVKYSELVSQLLSDNNSLN